MKNNCSFLIFFSFILFSNAQVGVGTISPEAALDLKSTTAGLLIPRIALTAKNVAAPVLNPNGGLLGNSTLIFNTATNGIAPNNVVPGFYYWNATLNIWVYLGTDSTVATTSWSLLGNSSTTATTNFIGTTDAQDLVFKTNGIQRIKIDNSVSSATGTAGDIEIGDANSGTLRSSKEFVIRQSGDVFGSSTLRLRHRNAENGAIFETSENPNLVDFIFRTGPPSNPISSNIRFEARFGATNITSNTTEWQIGQPGAINGGPTLVIGASGSGSRSSFRIGNLGVGTIDPTEKLDVVGSLKFSGALLPNNVSGTAGQILVSTGAGTAPVWEAKTVQQIILSEAATVYNVLVSDYTVRLSPAVTSVNLPDPTANRGKIFVIIKINGGATIPFTTPIGSIFDETLATPAIAIISSGERYMLQSNGANWIVIGR